MSRENVELVEQAIASFNRGGMDALRVYVDPAIEFHEPPEQPGGRVARGIEEATAVFGEFESAWESHKIEVVEIRAFGQDKVLLVTVEHFVGRDGVGVEAPHAAVLSIRNGKIVLWRSFWDRDRALEAVGLRE